MQQLLITNPFLFLKKMWGKGVIWFESSFCGFCSWLWYRKQWISQLQSWETHKIAKYRVQHKSRFFLDPQNYGFWLPAFHSDPKICQPSLPISFNKRSQHPHFENSRENPCNKFHTVFCVSYSTLNFTLELVEIDHGG